MSQSKMFITIKKANILRLCHKCNFAGRRAKEMKPCNYHSYGKSMNYRNVPSGMCALRPEDIKRMLSDYGSDREDRLSVK